MLTVAGACERSIEELEPLTMLLGYTWCRRGDYQPSMPGWVAVNPQQSVTHTGWGAAQRLKRPSSPPAHTISFLGAASTSDTVNGAPRRWEATSWSVAEPTGSTRRLEPPTTPHGVDDQSGVGPRRHRQPPGTRTVAAYTSEPAPTCEDTRGHSPCDEFGHATRSAAKATTCLTSGAAEPNCTDPRESWRHTVKASSV